MKYAFGFFLMVLLSMQVSATNNVCIGEKQCGANEDDKVECRVSVPENGFCEVERSGTSIECRAYENTGEIYDATFADCGGGPPDEGDVAWNEPCGTDFSGAWWVGCNPFY